MHRIPAGLAATPCYSVTRNRRTMISKETAEMLKLMTWFVADDPDVLKMAQAMTEFEIEDDTE